MGGEEKIDMGFPGEQLASGLIQGGATLLAGHMQNKANQKMNADNLRLAYIQRDDTLNQGKVDNAFRKKQAAIDNAYRDRESAYQKRQDARAAARQRLQDDTAFRSNLISMINAARGGRRI